MTLSSYHPNSTEYKIIYAMYQYGVILMVANIRSAKFFILNPEIAS